MKAKETRTPVDFTKWFGPTLEALRKLGGSGRPREVTEQIAKDLNLPDTLLEETLKSGISRFANQVQWARQYMVCEGLIDDSVRGVWALTPLGAKTHLSEEQSKNISIKWSQLKGAKQSKEGKETKSGKLILIVDDEREIITPTLLEVLQSVSPKGFESLCQRLLREHGFEDVQVTGRPRDGGIDGYGTLELNPFVSIKVLFQCKRYKGSVSRAQVGDFRNAMIGRAEKGIIITTGTFSEDAKREAARDGAPPIELIDGQKLVALFEKVQLGMKPKVVYDVDLHFFEGYMS